MILSAADMLWTYSNKVKLTGTLTWDLVVQHYSATCQHLEIGFLQDWVQLQDDMHDAVTGVEGDWK